mgnify:CR=1 FL=1
MASLANPSRDDFAAMLDDMFGGADSFEGRVVHGTVTAIENDLAVIDVTDDGLVVRELVDGVTQEELQEKTGAPLTFA